MDGNEYRCIQNELSELLDPKRIHQKYPHSGYAEAYRKAILDCKSKIHNFYHYRSRAKMNKAEKIPKKYDPFFERGFD